MLVPSAERKGTEVWFVHKRHRLVFVIDTSPSMRTLRGAGDAPLSEVAAALSACFAALARPMGTLRQEVFVSVVAQVHSRGPDGAGRDQVVGLVQGFLLTSADDAASHLAKVQKL
jgi:hypothetical protein